MMVLKFDGTTTDLSAETEPSTNYANANGFGPETTKNPYGANSPMGSPMPFPGGYKSIKVRTSQPTGLRSGIVSYRTGK